MRSRWDLWEKARVKENLHERWYTKFRDDITDKTTGSQVGGGRVENITIFIRSDQNGHD